MTEPATSTAASAGVFAMIGNGVIWLAGAIGLVTIGKILIDYINMRKDVLEMKQDVKKVLECSQNNAKQIAVLETKIEERTKND